MLTTKEPSQMENNIRIYVVETYLDKTQSKKKLARNKNTLVELKLVIQPYSKKLIERKSRAICH